MKNTTELYDLATNGILDAMIASKDKKVKSILRKLYTEIGQVYNRQIDDRMNERRLYMANLRKEIPEAFEAQTTN